MEEKYLTINEVCYQLGVSRQSVNNWRIAGLLSALNRDGRIVFKQSEVKSLSTRRIPPGRKRKEK